MKNIFIALAIAAGAFTGVAHADEATAARTQVQSKTRAQVRAELVQAQRSGELAALAKLYRGS